MEPTTRRIRAANGTAILIAVPFATGTATVEACAVQHHMTITGLVSPNVREVMLGIAFLKQEWNFNVGEVVLSGYRHKLYSRGRQAGCRRVILQNDTVIPGESDVGTV